MLELVYQMDWAVLYFIQSDLVHPSLNGIMRFFTHFGDIGATWLFIALLCLLSNKHRKLGLLLLIGLALQVVVGNLLLKPLIARPRPCFLDESISLLIKLPEDYSFPSGHTFSSFLCASLIVKYHKKWGYFATFLASLIAFSRLYLFVHFPSDVIGGMILGLSLARLVFLFYPTKKGS